MGQSSVLFALQDEVEKVVSIGAEAASVSLSAETLMKQFPCLSPTQAEECVALAKLVQVHHCVPYCQEKQPELEFCEQYFPMLPSLYPHMAIRPKMETEQDKGYLQLVQKAWHGLKQQLVNDRKEGRKYSEGSSVVGGGT